MIKKIQANKMLITATFTSIMVSPLTSNIAQADTLLGADIEVGVWSPSYDGGSALGDISGDDQSIFISATIEHPVPIIPNLKLSVSEVNSDSYEYTKIDYTAYYEILDNDVITFDLGLGVSQFSDGEFLSLPFSGVIPHAYFDAEFSLPFSHTTLYTDIHYLNYDGNEATDAIAGLRYDFNLVALDLGIKAGYRVQRFDAKSFDNLSFDIETDGFFLGLHADF